jgi:hypothetical protein
MTKHHPSKDVSNRPPRPQHSASRHPAKVAKPMQRPNPARDGFNPTSVLAQQLERVWQERDCPLSERKDKE